MQCYSISTTLIVILLQQYHAQDKIDQVHNKSTKNAVDELLKKINDISVQSFSHAPYSRKLEMLRKVEEKLKKAAVSLGRKGERYVQLIMKGIRARTLTEMYDNNKTEVEPMNMDAIYKVGGKNDVLDNNRIIKISSESHGVVENNVDLSKSLEKSILILANKTDNDVIDKNENLVLETQLRRMNVDSKGSKEPHGREDSVARAKGSNEQRIYKSSVTQETYTNQLIQSLTPRYECEGILDSICLHIKEMRQLKCLFEDSIISIEKLCDGSADCIDGTDEKFCISQVAERMENANQVISQTNEAFELGCFPNKTKQSIMTTQIIILRSVLQAQQEFLDKYKYFNRSLLPNNESFKTEGTVKRAVNEISVIINTLALALHAELCSQRVKTGDDINARKFNDLLIEDFDKVLDEVEWPPKYCTCIREHCENITTCTKTCKRFCWQKHSLTRWACPSINDTENVPISVICDGKFDCFDQSDEKDCVTGLSFAKYEAHKIFQEILSSLSVKVISKEYAFIRNMLLSLHNTIEELQKFCMSSEPDLKIIRILRNRCFSALSSIYSVTFTKSSFLYQKSEIYLFLMSLNENIVDALKRSHTGNKKIISNDRCYCRNGRCSMPLCSRNCLRSCIAEPWLTRYICENSLNKSVSLDDICNGEPNCPREDDEAHCKKEICRRHHLTLLRHSLQKIGKKQEGTSMGELLSTWKIKVSSTLLIAENNYRPNPSTIRDIIKDILRDLVMTYGAVNDYRRDIGYALEEFINIAKYIMLFLSTLRGEELKMHKILMYYCTSSTDQGLENILA